MGDNRKAVSLRLPIRLLTELDELADSRGLTKTRIFEYFVDLGRLHERYSTQLEQRLQLVEGRLSSMEESIKALTKELRRE